MRRWFDGLHDIYEGKNEIEIKLGLFGGDGGEGGGGTPTEGTNAINRGTVGMTAAEMNARADAQERGSREVANLSAGVTPSANFGYSRSFDTDGPGDFDTGDDSPVAERFVTSTEAAYRDLDRRADIGQMPNISKGFETPIGRIPTPTSVAFGALNKFGMNRAQDIRDQINTGGSPITDRYGRIQGVVSEGTGPVADLLGAFGQNTNVYTGGSSFAPSTAQLMSYRPDPTRQGIASLPYADVQMPTTTAPLAAQPLSQNRGTLTPAKLENLQPTKSNPQYGTVDDPMAQAGLGSFFTETIPGAFGSLYDYATGAPKARASGYSKPIGRGGVARQYYTAPGEKFFKNPITEYFSTKKN